MFPRMAHIPRGSEPQPDDLMLRVGGDGKSQGWGVGACSQCGSGTDSGDLEQIPSAFLDHPGSYSGHVCEIRGASFGDFLGPLQFLAISWKKRLREAGVGAPARSFAIV